MDKDELIEKFKEWAEKNGWEDAIDSAPRDGSDWAVATTTVGELGYDFIEELDEDEVFELGGPDAAIQKMMALADEMGPYWQPGSDRT